MDDANWRIKASLWMLREVEGGNTDEESETAAIARSITDAQMNLIADWLAGESFDDRTPPPSSAAQVVATNPEINEATFSTIKDGKMYTWRFPRAGVTMDQRVEVDEEVARDFFKRFYSGQPHSVTFTFEVVASPPVYTVQITDIP